MVKNLPAMQKTWVLSLGWEDLLEEAWQPTPVFLSGESPWTEEPGGLHSTRVAKSQIQLNNETQHSVVVLFVVFWEASILFSTVAAPICISTNSVHEFPFLTLWNNFYMLAQCLAHSI